MTVAEYLARDWARSCQGKTRFGKRGAIWKQRELQENGEAWLNVYQCEFCHAWHIGHLRAEDMRQADRQREEVR